MTIINNPLVPPVHLQPITPYQTSPNNGIEATQGPFINLRFYPLYTSVTHHNAPEPSTVFSLRLSREEYSALSPITKWACHISPEPPGHTIYVRNVA
jgi:hypothetical protein